MTSKAKKRPPARKRATFTRTELLPLVSSIAHSMSLRNHMSLAALRVGQGNLDLAGELLKALYWTYYLSDVDTLSAHERDFVGAEQSLKASIVKGAAEHQWGLDASGAGHLATILQLHDQQLASVPVYELDRAKERLLKRLVRGEFPSFEMA